MDLFAGIPDARPTIERLGDGATLLRRFAAGRAVEVAAAIRVIAAAAPFRRMVTPGGHTMSVAMTNCGPLGWCSSSRGYRYDAIDPDTGCPWPAMPEVLRRLADEAASAGGFAGYVPDACLINEYRPGAKLSLHQDRDEGDLVSPVVSVSLGLPATFLWGGPTRAERPVKVRVEHGDVVVFGGASRLMFHGVSPLAAADHPLLGPVRWNLTFRKTR